MDPARARLTAERKDLRGGGLPFGYSAKPEVLADGSNNLLKWNCLLPGKAGKLRLPLPLPRLDSGAAARPAALANRRLWRRPVAARHSSP